MTPRDGGELTTVEPDLARLAGGVAAGRLGTPIHLVAETGSTNDDAKAGARSGAPHGAVWVAETQSHGRGRQGRGWTSPHGENLLFSVLLRIKCVPARVPPLSLACGLVVRDAVADALGGDARVLLKWPNDVVIQEREGAGFRKVAGILVESALAGSAVEHVVVGIGINVHTRDFPAELGSIATSIGLAGAARPDRAAVLTDVLVGLDRDLEAVAHRGLAHLHSRLLAHDALADRPVESDDGLLRGTACGIDLDGRLLVRRADGIVTKVASGEVRLRLSS